MKLFKDFLIAKPHDVSLQLMSPSLRPEEGQEKVVKLILIKTSSIIDPRLCFTLLRDDDLYFMCLSGCVTMMAQPLHSRVLFEFIRTASKNSWIKQHEELR